MRRGQEGVSLTGLVVVLGLLVVVLFGLLFAMYNAGTSSNDLTRITPTTGATTTTLEGATTTSTTVLSATTAACAADYVTVNLAVAAYEDENHAPPPSGRAWASSTANGGPYLRTWPSPEGHIIRWTGSTLIVVPAHGEPSAGPGTASPPTGCYAG